MRRFRPGNFQPGWVPPSADRGMGGQELEDLLQLPVLVNESINAGAGCEFVGQWVGSAGGDEDQLAVRETLRELFGKFDAVPLHFQTGDEDVGVEVCGGCESTGDGIGSASFVAPGLKKLRKSLDRGSIVAHY